MSASSTLATDWATRSPESTTVRTFTPGGSVLVRRVMQHARGNGVKRLYLYTPDQAQLYAKLGWQIHSEEPYNGTPVTIMSIDFD